jgi:hypothetical protein
MKAPDRPADDIIIALPLLLLLSPVPFRYI